MTRTEPWCPHCCVAMQSRAYEQAAIWTCSTCGGMFLPAQQLRAITVDESTPRPPEARTAELAAARSGPSSQEVMADPTRCPWCVNVMQRVRYGGDSAILVDRCVSECGLWLDAGELERIEAWSEANRAGMNAPAPAPVSAPTTSGADPAPQWNEFQATDRDQDLGYQLRGMTGTHAPWEDGGLGDSIVDAVMTEHRRKRREQAKAQDLLAWAEQQRRPAG